jgi:membrane protein YqaA with SNARE-associated domain
MGILIAAGIWGFAEATLFFIVPDVLLSAIAIRNLRAALLASLVAVAGAMIGGTLMYLWGAANPETALPAVTAVPAVGGEMMARAFDDMQRIGPWAVVLGPLSATPYKVYAVQGAAAGMPYWLFLLISPIARLPRFVMASLVAGGASRLLGKYVDRKVIYTLWLLAWITVYFLLWT